MTGQGYPKGNRFTQGDGPPTVPGRRGVRAAVATAIALVAVLALAQPALAAPDFQLTIDPSSQTLPPGGSVSFVVKTAAVDGFSGQIELSVGALPSGVTARLSKNPLGPSDSAFLTLIAASDAEPGTFEVGVTGTGGGLSHTTGSVVTVNFGLVPICYGTFTGVVTDADTGEPIVGARVSSSPHFAFVFTDDDGRYTIEKRPLGANNAPLAYTLTSTKDGYWFGRGTGVGICDQVTTVDLVMVRQKPGTVSGTVYVGTPDAANRSIVHATSTPIGGARVSVTGHSPMTAAADGTFQSGPIQVRHNNEPILNATMSATAAGYWHNNRRLDIHSERNTVADLALVRQCHSGISGTVVFEDTGQPAAGKTVTAWVPWASYTTTADEGGRFSFPAVLQAHNNGPATYQVFAAHNGYFTAIDHASLSACDTHDTVALVFRPVPVNVPNYGFVEGYVRDEETGEPVANACVPFIGCWGRTDETGYYKTRQILVSQDSSRATQDYFLNAGAAGYWWSESVRVTVIADQTVRQDFVVLRQRQGKIAGVVRDAATKLPIEQASVGLGGAGRTGPDGAYESGDLPLNYRNAPRDHGFWTSATGYWPKFTGNVRVEADRTTQQDVELIPVCDDARVVGTVVSAATNEPIEGARVIGGGKSATTDAQGRYAIEGLRVGTNNSPIQVSLTASATGFFSQTKRVTVFCGATIILDFGAPADVFGTIEVLVTNAVTGEPMGGVFVGSEWGAALATDANGVARFDNDVPLEFDGSERTWRITADPDDFAAQSKPVAAKANTTVRLEFQFGAQSRTLAFTAEGLPPDAFWQPTVNGTQPAATAPFTYPAVVPDASSVSFSAPETIAGGAGVRFVLDRWVRASDGVAVSSPVTASADETYRAVYETEYELAVSAGGHGTVVGDGWYPEGAEATFSISPVVVEGDPGIRYVFSRWSGDSTATSSSSTVTMDAAKSVAAEWRTQYFLEVGADPPSAGSGVRGSGWYDEGATATVEADRHVAVAAGTRFDFRGWGGDASGSELAAAVLMDAPKRASASYGLQHFLTVATDPAAAADGNELAGEGWYDEGTSAAVSALRHVPVAEGSRFDFRGWGGDASGSELAAGVLMDRPKTATASYRLQHFLTVVSDPAEAGSGVRGSGWFDEGTTATVEADRQVPVAEGSRFDFRVWGGDASGSELAAAVLMDRPKTATAAYRLQHFLTVTADPAAAAGGNELAGAGWYDDGTTAAVSALRHVPVAEGTRYDFRGWAGDASGEDVSTTLLMTRPKTATAAYRLQHFVTTSTNFGTVSPASGWYDDGEPLSFSAAHPATVDGERYVWLGWSGGGTGGYSGLDNPVTVTLVAPMSESAAWRHEFRLTVRTDGIDAGLLVAVLDGPARIGEAGDAAPLAVWIEEDDAVELDLETPVVAHRTSRAFERWSGDASGSSRPARILMDGPREATGHYVAFHTTGYMTDSQYQLIEGFDVIVRADRSGYTVTGTNPGQYYQHVVLVNTWSAPLAFTVRFSPPGGQDGFYFKGAMPIHAYVVPDGLSIPYEPTMPGIADVTPAKDSADLGADFVRVTVQPGERLWVDAHFDWSMKGEAYDQADWRQTAYSFAAAVGSATFGDVPDRSSLLSRPKETE